MALLTRELNYLCCALFLQPPQSICWYDLKRASNQRFTGRLKDAFLQCPTNLTFMNRIRAVKERHNPQQILLTDEYYAIHIDRLRRDYRDQQRLGISHAAPMRLSGDVSLRVFIGTILNRSCGEFTFKPPQSIYLKRVEEKQLIFGASQISTALLLLTIFQRKKLKTNANSS